MTFLRRRDVPRLGSPSTEPLVPAFDDNPQRLLVLFERLPSFDAARLRRAIHDVDPHLPDIRTEIVTEALEATTHGLAGWGADEVVHIDGTAKAPEASILESLLSHAPLEAREIARARAVKGQVVLTYVGRTSAPEIKFLALAVVASAFVSLHGAVLVGNRVAHTAIPAAALRHAAGRGLAGLRDLPRLALACGFDQFPVSGWRGTWSRTYGAPRIGLPDLARRSPELETREQVAILFTAIHDYLRATGATIRPGDRLDAGPAAYVAREPRRNESWLRSEEPLLVLDDHAAD